MYCKKCGAQIEDNTNYCSVCGEFLAEKPVTSSQKREINLAQLVWSIISLVCLCLPLGIVSLVSVLSAQDAKTDEEEARHLKRAKTCNIVATVLVVVLFAFALGIMLLPFIFVGIFA